MKILIPKTRQNFELSENTVSITKIDTSKIIVLSGMYTSALGLLTKIPNGQWTLIDMLQANNFWDITSDNPIDVFDCFSTSDWQILQFENRYEFLTWLKHNMPAIHD